MISVLPSISVPMPSVATSPPFSPPNAAFRELLEHVRVEVNERLLRLFRQREEEARSHGADVGAMVSAVRDLILRGGKRFRPALVQAAMMACGGSHEDAAMQVGVALELLQGYMLIHDDWMDGDFLRRGGPTVHTMLTQHHGNSQIGEASAILAGDYTSALALDEMTRLPLPAEQVLEAIRLFGQVQQDAVFGQQLDISGRAEDVERMHDLKTGSYTVRGPLLLGAVIAGAPEVARVGLRAFAAPLGVAFQLRDDLLGVFGKSEETGKPRGSDLTAGKRTSLVAAGRERLHGEDRAALERVFGNAEAPREEVERVIEALDHAGARAAVEAQLVKLSQRAIQELAASAPPQGWNAGGEELLRGAATALVVRSA